MHFHFQTEKSQQIDPHQVSLLITNKASYQNTFGHGPDFNLQNLHQLKLFL